MYIEPCNKVVIEKITKYLTSSKIGEEMQHFNDMDSTVYHIQKKGTDCIFQMTCAGLKEIIDLGGNEILDEKYKSYKPQYDDETKTLSFTFDMKLIPSIC